MARNLWLVTHRTIVRISDISAIIKGADCIIYAVLRNKDPIALTYELTGNGSLEEKFTEFKDLLLES